MNVFVLRQTMVHSTSRIGSLVGVSIMALQYLRVSWSHDYDQEPVEYFSEVDEDGRELRKVVRYRDGRWDWADKFRDTDEIGLSEVPISPVEEIKSDDEFDGELISVEAFESAWQRARHLASS